MELKGRVENGNVAVDLPEGTPVTILVREEDVPPGPYDEEDENGDPILTPELEAELERAESSTDWITLDELKERLRKRRSE
ncbi:MAG: hypothetical protein AB7T06_00215 [Kofleriaceae bacterium]